MHETSSWWRIKISEQRGQEECRIRVIDGSIFRLEGSSLTSSVFAFILIDHKDNSSKLKI